MQNAREKRALRYPAPFTRNQRPAFCAKLLILLILPEKRPGRWAAQRGGAGQQVRAAGAARFGELNHITSFITHEMPGCQYRSRRRPDSGCLRSCQSPPAILPAKFTPSSLQAVLSLLITLQPSHAGKSEIRRENSFQPFRSGIPLCKRQRFPLAMRKRWGRNAVFYFCPESKELTFILPRKMLALSAYDTVKSRDIN